MSGLFTRTYDRIILIRPNLDDAHGDPNKEGGPDGDDGPEGDETQERQR